VKFLIQPYFKAIKIKFLLILKRFCWFCNSFC